MYHYDWNIVNISVATIFFVQIFHFFPSVLFFVRFFFIVLVHLFAHCTVYIYLWFAIHSLCLYLCVSAVARHDAWSQIVISIILCFAISHHVYESILELDGVASCRCCVISLMLLLLLSTRPSLLFRRFFFVLLFHFKTNR